MFKVRHPVTEDIPDLLEIEFDRYKTLYKEQPNKQQEIEERFRKRIKIASEWMWVIEEDKKVLGFITGQPTNEEPKDFTSWESSTNNGTLEGKFFPRGQNVYVVNLDVKRQATVKNGQYILMSYLGAKVIKEGKSRVIFESRMPGFREWVREVKKMNSHQWNGLKQEVKQEMAEHYASLTTLRDGSEVLYDRLLRFYEEAGFTFIKVLPNAFEDVESLNYGVLCVGNNPVPKVLRVAPINFLAGFSLRIFGRSQKLLEKFVG